MKFDHIAVSVQDVTGSVIFYRELFPKAVILYQDESWALIQVDELKIAFVTEGKHPPHLAFRVESREELQVQANKWGGRITAHRDRSESFYKDDPEGNAIEIIYYPH